jgi:cytochrome bd-type quinol oxidase subunit 2
MSDSEKYMLIAATAVLIFIILVLTKYKNTSFTKPTVYNSIALLLIFAGLFLSAFPILGFIILGIGISFAVYDLLKK